MKTFFLSLSVLASFTLSAQYYYNDIISTLEANQTMKNFITQKVKSATAVGFDEHGSRATDFSEVQEVKENGTILRTATIVKLTKTVITSTFDNQARLVQTIDSSAGAQNTTSYSYDAAGRLIRIENNTKGVDQDFNQVEIHQWTYTASGRPDKMWRTVNGGDSLEIRFTADDKDNAGEEVTYNRGRETDHVYYYYDAQKRITDVVRYNKKIKKLMPESMIDYDDAGRVIKVISSTAPAKFGKITWVGYQIWAYKYNENGLKVEERVFNHAQDLVGSVKYGFRYDR